MSKKINSFLKYCYFEVFNVWYFLSEGNELCSTDGHIAVNDEIECKVATTQLDLVFNTTEDKADMPKGCYLSGVVYFNRHLSGSRKYNARQICKPRGKVNKIPSITFIMI